MGWCPGVKSLELGIQKPEGRPQTQVLKPPNPKPYTLNPKILNPKAYTRNPKPQTQRS